MASDGGALPQLLDVELRDLLVHLWGVHIVEQLLDGHCLVHELQPDSDGDFDLSMFKLCVWCDDLEGTSTFIFGPPCARATGSCG